MSAMTQSPQKNNEVKIRSSHVPNDTHITLYIPPTYRMHVERNSIQCEDDRFYEEIDKHGMDENFLDTKIGKFLEDKIKFLDMTYIIEESLNKISYIANPNLDQLIETDRLTREYTQEKINKY